MKKTIAISLLAFAIGCGSRDVSEPSAPTIRPGFPLYPPITDANPDVSVRRVFHVPTRLIVERTPERIDISVDGDTLEAIELDVGHNMVAGFKHDLFVISGQKRHLWGSGLGGSAYIGTPHITRQLDGIPEPNESYVVEVTFVIFETDIPAQHMWEPESGRYRELWERTITSEEL